MRVRSGLGKFHNTREHGHISRSWLPNDFISAYFSCTRSIITRSFMQRHPKIPPNYVHFCTFHHFQQEQKARQRQRQRLQQRAAREEKRELTFRLLRRVLGPGAHDCPRHGGARVHPARHLGGPQQGATPGGGRPHDGTTVARHRVAEVEHVSARARRGAAVAVIQALGSGQHVRQ